MNNELRSFIKESLERGQSKDAIHTVLTQSGWEDGEVRNGLAAFADVDCPIAVPRPTPYLHAREAFLYLVSFIALYVSAISFGFLVFGLIDHTFHDPLAYRDRFPSTGEATSIASVIVAFPLYLFLMKRLASEMAAEPEKRRSLVRRWLTYLTLVIAAGFILGDVIALLANLLTGDLAFLFLLKGLAILAVTACIFGFYLWDMRRVGDSGRQRQRDKCPASALGHSRRLGHRLPGIFDVSIGHTRGAAEPEVRRAANFRPEKHLPQRRPLLGSQPAASREL